MNNAPGGRRFARAPVSLEVQYRTKGSFLVSYSLNLSKGGLFLETDDLLPVGTTLTVRFSIPGSAAPIETLARVMWVRRSSSDEGLPPGLGLQFDNLEGHIGETIDEMARDFSGVTLLALADDPSALSRLTRYLKSTLTCEVIQESATSLSATGFTDVTADLTLLDLDSAGDGGLLLIQMAARESKPPLPVVALTADPLVKALAIKEGAATVLDNPPAYEELRRCVLEVLGRPHRR